MVLLLWKLLVSWGHLRVDTTAVCEPMHFPGTLGFLEDCSRETAIGRLKMYDFAFGWWEEHMGTVMYDLCNKAADAGKLSQEGQYIEGQAPPTYEEFASWGEAGRGADVLTSTYCTVL